MNNDWYDNLLITWLKYIYIYNFFMHQNNIHIQYVNGVLQPGKTFNMDMKQFFTFSSLYSSEYKTFQPNWNLYASLITTKSENRKSFIWRFISNCGDGASRTFWQPVPDNKQNCLGFYPILWQWLCKEITLSLQGFSGRLTDYWPSVICAER